MVVSDIKHADARDEVEILLAFHVPDQRAFCAGDGDRMGREDAPRDVVVAQRGEPGGGDGHDLAPGCCPRTIPCLGGIAYGLVAISKNPMPKFLECSAFRAVSTGYFSARRISQRVSTRAQRQ